MNDLRHWGGQPDRGTDLLQQFPVLLTLDSAGSSDDYVVENSDKRFEDFAFDRTESIRSVLSKDFRNAAPGFFRDALIDIDKAESKDLRQLVGNRGLPTSGRTDDDEIRIFLAIEHFALWQAVHCNSLVKGNVAMSEVFSYRDQLQIHRVASFYRTRFYHSPGETGKGIMHIQTESKESVLIWQINRPDRRNALGPIIAEELWAKVSELGRLLPRWPEASAKPRLLAIKAFSDKGDDHPIWIAGGDLKELAQLKEKAEGRKYAETMSKVCESLQNLPIPVVMLIDGLVIGGGVEFALAADLRFATRRSSFHFKQLELGLSTAYASAARLTHLLGAARSMNFLLRSSRISALEAHDIGLITELVDDAGALDCELSRLAGDILKLNPASVAAQKKLLMIHSGNENTALELDVFEDLWMNDYHKASLKKFLKTESLPKD